MPTPQPPDGSRLPPDMITDLQKKKDYEKYHRSGRFEKDFVDLCLFVDKNVEIHHSDRCYRSGDRRNTLSRSSVVEMKAEDTEVSEEIPQYFSFNHLNVAIATEPQ